LRRWKREGARREEKGVGEMNSRLILASHLVANESRSAAGVLPPQFFVFCFAKCGAKEFTIVLPVRADKDKKPLLIHHIKFIAIML
jgi:hypothetical protein